MNYALIFVHKTALYSVHAFDCSAAQDKKGQTRIRTENSPVDFTSIEAAQAYANEDEQAKGGDSAKFRVCKCTKG